MLHKLFNEEALALAKSSRDKTNHPFGAVLVYDGQIVLRAENAVVTTHDVTQHAELRLVSKASQRFNRAYLNKATLYASTEPCAMCAGAIYWAGIRNVVFGMSAKKLGELTTGSFVVESREIFKFGREVVHVTGPIDSQESQKVHENFW